MNRIGVVGATGRTGSKVVEALGASKTSTLGAAIVSASSALLYNPVGQGDVHYSSDLAALKGCHAVIEFSRPQASVEAVEQCAQLGIPVLVATTGHSPQELSRIEAAAQAIPVAIASNTSVGAAVLTILVEKAREMLGPDFDVEAMEIHHRMKRDAPSGTARTLVAAALNEGDVVAYGREGLRSRNEVGVAALRGGDVPGDHTVYFLGNGERLELTHRVHDRGVFGAGAVTLAEKLIGRKAGLYSVRTLLLG